MQEEAQNVSNDSNNYEKSMYQNWTQPAHIKSHITWAKKGYNARFNDGPELGSFGSALATKECLNICTTSPKSKATSSLAVLPREIEKIKSQQDSGLDRLFWMIIKNTNEIPKIQFEHSAIADEGLS